MNKYKFFTMLWMLLYASVAFCQQDNLWYFGQWAGLDFTSGSPVAVTNSTLSTIEGCLTMCDVNGNLLFYSTGNRLWNRNRQPMQNSNGLLGDHSSSQSCIAVLKPGSQSQYYLFVTDAGALPNGLSYSEIDMNAANGLGAVTNKNIRLVTPVAEKLAACYHSNGTDIWITVKHWGSDAFYSYLVTAQGVSTIPVISHSGIITDGTGNSGKYAGYMAISPDGRHLAIANNGLNTQLFSFNNATGIVSSPITLSSGIEHAYGVEFSPSSNRLYVARDSRLFQYTLGVPDVAATEVLIANIVSACAIKLGPDGKLYVNPGNLQLYLSVVNNPDESGAACNFTSAQVDLAGKKTISGLPNSIATPLYLTSVSANSNCAGNAVSFTFTATMPVDYMQWDFGDGTSSTVINPTHIYSIAGTYTIKAKARKGNMVRYFNRTITIIPSPLANQPQDMIACAGAGTTTATFDLSQQNAQVLGTQPTTDYVVTYHLTQQDAEQGTNVLPLQYTNTATPQVLYARVTGIAGGNCAGITSFQLVVRQKPVVIMNSLYTFCTGNTTTITAPAGFDAYLWSTGATIQSIQAAPGNYTLTVFRNYGGVLCDASAIFAVRQSGAPVIREIRTDDWTDHNNTIQIIAEGNGDFEYSIDGVNWQAAPLFTGLEPGVYNVHAKDANGCGHDDKEVALLMYPKYFTPNGDSVHEMWRIKFGQYEANLQVYIFDRFGKLLTSFKGASAGWDGKLNGRELPSTDYWFVAIRHDGTQHKGHFSMLR